MKSRIPLQGAPRFSLLALAVFIVAVTVVAVPFYSVRSSSSPKGALLQPKISTVSTARRVSRSTILNPFAPSALSPLPLSSLGVVTYDATCTTPQSDFNLGNTVCVKATGVPGSLFPWRISWVDPAGFITQSDPAITDDNAQYFYVIPAAPTSSINGQTVDNRGTWRVNLTRPNGAIMQTARFVVHETANPQADVFVQKFQRDASDQPHSGENIAFIVVVGNAGPDAAQNVHLIDSLPSGGTLVSFTQTLGPACSPAGASDCTITSMSNGDRAEFTAIYNVSGSAGTYTASATVSSATPDPDTSNNSSTVSFNIQSGTGTGSSGCDLTCPSNVSAFADTTEGGQRGTHVTFSTPSGTGQCGSISTSPASGSFFPVGTTVVAASSETGDGSCQFTVTVEDVGGTAIICPANKEANADSSCQATVSVGTPTTTGDNVTVSGSRSDGRPLTDPYPTGITTITWIAYSHDTPGPWDDEEAHRTGSASCTQTVTVNDVTPPVIVTAPQTASADANCQAVVPDFTATATVSDNCACASSDTSQACVNRTPLSVTQNPAPGTVVGLGPHTITLTANDGSSNNGGTGNTTVVTTTFTVNDTTAPTLNATAPAPVSADASCQAAVPTVAYTTSDNCSAVTVTQSPAAGTLVAKGTTQITLTAKDAAGNTTTASVNFVVNDTTPPVISCPTDITVYLPLHSTATSMAVNYAATATDNCGVQSITYSIAPGSVFSVGTTPVTVTATDTSGNTASCTFHVTVLYDFTGFFSPVGNPPTLNVVKAGSAVPVKFSLSGNKGLNIFALNSPASVSSDCGTATGVDVTDTVTAGGSSLSYDATSDQYVYVWKTDSSWAGTCRQLIVTLNDGSVHVANFKFK
jgi:uncharacterized repeat protein (TIGR01451 family)